MRVYIGKQCMHTSSNHTGEKVGVRCWTKKILIKEIRILEFITFFRQDTLRWLIFQATSGGDACCVPSAVLVISYQYSLEQQKQPYTTKNN